MAPTDDDAKTTAGNMQAFKRCVKCDGQFPTAVHGKLLGKIEVRKDRRG